jgi:hypothetical protein
MKKDKYQRRFYRDWIKAQGLCLNRITQKETDLEVLTDKPIEKDFLQKRINHYRNQIEDYISKDRKFLTALKPMAVELNAPSIIKEMAKAAKKANVGPMAAVAGAIAQFLGGDLLKKGYKEVIIENGGDIFLKISQIRSVGIYAGESKLWKGLKIKIKPKDTPLGICTSSGTIGHSLSFGLADAAIILSKSASLADAVATATCNRVKTKEDLEIALGFAKSIQGISAAVIMIKNNIIAWGKFEFVR